MASLEHTNILNYFSKTIINYIESYSLFLFQNMKTVPCIGRFKWGMSSTVPWSMKPNTEGKKQSVLRASCSSSCYDLAAQYIEPPDYFNFLNYFRVILIDYIILYSLFLFFRTWKRCPVIGARGHRFMANEALYHRKKVRYIMGFIILRRLLIWRHVAEATELL